MATLGGLVLGQPPAAAATTNFNVANSGMSAFVIDGASNPTLTLKA